MNIIFSLLLLSSCILTIINCPDMLFTSMLTGAEQGVHLMLTLFTIYAIWMSILDIMDKIGLSRWIGQIAKPITSRLFPHEDDKTIGLISNNFSFNMLGMGGAATPLGIEAMEKMSKDRTKLSDNAILFLVINATSIQLLPSTIIGLRASNGSTSPSDIIIPSLIATTIATLVGIVTCKCLSHHE